MGNSVIHFVRAQSQQRFYAFYLYYDKRGCEMGNSVIHFVRAQSQQRFYAAWSSPRETFPFHYNPSRQKNTRALCARVFLTNLSTLRFLLNQSSGPYSSP